MTLAKLPQRISILVTAGLLLIALGCSDSKHSGSTSPVQSSASVNDFNGFLDGSVPLQDIINETGITVDEYDPTDNFIAFSSTLDEASLQSIAGFEVVDEDGFLTEPSDLLITFSKGYLSEAQMLGQTQLTCIDLSASHAKATGNGVRIAVLDTGFELNHPHLLGHLEVPAQPFDPQAGAVGDHRGHGTHTAGLIATVAPAATILPIRVMGDDGLGLERDLLKGLRIASENNVDIVNLSLSMNQHSEAVEFMIQTLVDDGVLVIAAAGNYTGTPSSKYPARYPMVIGVASTSNNTCNALLTSSGLGIGIQFATAGEDVLSASYPLGNGAPGAARGTGTSVSTAVFTGAVALNMTVRRRTVVLDPYDFTAEFQSTALSIAPYGQVEWGAIDLLAALTLAAQ
ncbi:MAG: S8 family serine peptidase [Candidatus Eisenbacteria bacterium]|uniref:S8 family serine peptidase n=1 Tax=Eiseniibacteriota bacterium TaxID=2212470 RepID=A0A7Y2E7D7_UNCEI|nr:S8 family serine peptidase [Candidatus Eisenbacteria bacterium]